MKILTGILIATLLATALTQTTVTYTYSNLETNSQAISPCYSFGQALAATDYV